MTQPLGKIDLFFVFLRLLLMQALLNRRGMQNLALTNALAPLRARFGSAGDDKLFLERHLRYFNCNPNVVPLIAGGVLRLEMERAQGTPVNDVDIEQFKRALASPLAAMGDMLFLGSLKPLALTFACIFAIYRLPLGLLAVFLLYNVIIISCRLWGIYFGYARGWELVDIFSGPQFQRVLDIVQGFGAGIGGVLVGIIFNRLPQNGQWALALGGAVTVVTLLLLKRDVPAAWFAIVLFPLSVLVTLLFV